MKYAIYAELADGRVDSINVHYAYMRDAIIKDYLTSDLVKHVAWCKVYRSGEYGKFTCVS